MKSVLSVGVTRRQMEKHASGEVSNLILILNGTRLELRGRNSRWILFAFLQIAVRLFAGQEHRLAIVESNFETVS